MCLWAWRACSARKVLSGRNPAPVLCVKSTPHGTPVPQRHNHILKRSHRFNPAKLLRAMVLCVAVLCASGLVQRSLAQSFQANQTSGCSPLGIVINVTSPDPGTIVSYAWNITRPDGTSQASTSPTFIGIFSQPGSYDVTLTINGAMTTTVNDYITVYGLPQANLSVDDPEGCFRCACSLQTSVCPPRAAPL